MRLTGNIVDVLNKKIFYGTVVVDDNRISQIEIEAEEKPGANYILPGFIDSHIHIESSMLVPSQFAKLAVRHGTTGTISDPHEIANVCGLAGVEYMINDSKSVPLKIHFGAPSCVPATNFETAGAAITSYDVETLLQRDDIYYLSEMMNFPGVLFSDAEVLQKIAHAKKYNKPVDGHAPGLTGEQAITYINAGIQTDHECVTYEEALHKIVHGMKILIREGSAAKNFDALIALVDEYPEMVMFCSDDKHPDDLIDGHINKLCSRAVKKGFDLFNILRAACINPVLHYGMRNGILRVNDTADCAIVNNLEDFEILQTYIDGNLVYNCKCLFEAEALPAINNFHPQKKHPEDFKIISKGSDKHLAIGALDGQIVTEAVAFDAVIRADEMIADPNNDLLKIAVVNRYNPAKVFSWFIKNTGIQYGAIASTVAHDSHNIVVVGCTDEDMCRAVNILMEHTGGIAAVKEQIIKVLPLPVAGLMSTHTGEEVAALYKDINAFVKTELKSTLTAPFMTLSFMALPVIPALKITDLGLVDVDQFKFIAQV